MEIVVEDGTGMVTANAYATVVEIDAILAYQTHASAWPTLEEAEKEKLIIWASQILDQRTRWKGRKTHETQGMGWPRTGAKDCEGIYQDEDIVPMPVKTAVAILANHLITFNPNEANESANLTMLQADVITLRFDPYATVYRYPDSVIPALRCLGTGSFGRGGPKRIIKY